MLFWQLLSQLVPRPPGPSLVLQRGGGCTGARALPCIRAHGYCLKDSNAETKGNEPMGRPSHNCGTFPLAAWCNCYVTGFTIRMFTTGNLLMIWLSLALKREFVLFKILIHFYFFIYLYFFYFHSFSFIYVH